MNKSSPTAAKMRLATYSQLRVHLNLSNNFFIYYDIYYDRNQVHREKLNFMNKNTEQRLFMEYMLFILPMSIIL